MTEHPVQQKQLAEFNQTRPSPAPLLVSTPKVLNKTPFTHLCVMVCNANLLSSVLTHSQKFFHFSKLPEFSLLGLI